MAKKGKRFDTRTLLIILLVLVIIGGGYIIITNLPEEVDFVTPDEIVDNKAGYLGQNVIVKGYYDTDANQPVIISSTSQTEEQKKLKLDYSNILNATDDLRAGTMYFFTGKIVEDQNSIIFDVILVAEKFERV